MSEDYEVPTGHSGGMTYSLNKPLIPNGILPCGRGGTSCVFADGKLITFGGNYPASEGTFEFSDETWLLDCAQMVWHKMACSGEIPPPRYGHSAHIVGSRMFVFGGKGPKGALYNCIYFLDLMEWVWVRVAAIAQGPCSRLFHASELVGRKIVVHGGWDGSKAFGDLWIFNTDSFGWSRPKTTGFEPSARYGHTVTLFPDGRMFMFGGVILEEDKKQKGVGLVLPKYKDDLRQLDTTTMVWTRPTATGCAPTGRYGHTATVLGDDSTKLVVFGGWGAGGCQTREMINDSRAYTIHVFDTMSMKWYTPKRTGGKNPALRHLYNHAACSTGANSSSLLIFGGFDGRQASNDFIVINTDLGAI